MSITSEKSITVPVELPLYLREISMKDGKQAPDANAYPFAIPSIGRLKRLKFHPNVTFLVGENGSGKSTLIEAIAVAYGFNPEGGSRNFSFQTRASHSDLHQYLRVVKGITRPQDGYFLRAESYFNVGTEIENLDKEPAGGPPIINSYGGISLHEQSHGESFLALLKHRIGGKGLYIFDEPEAALSPARQLRFLAILHDLVGKNSQFIIATHSPIIMAYPNSLIYRLDEDGIKPASYESTEHYLITRSFLNNREVALRELLHND